MKIYGSLLQKCISSSLLFSCKWSNRNVTASSTSAVSTGEGELSAGKKVLLTWDTLGSIFSSPLVVWKYWSIACSAGKGVLFKSEVFQCLWCPGSCSVAVSWLRIKHRGCVGLYQQRVCGEQAETQTVAGHGHPQQASPGPWEDAPAVSRDGLMPSPQPGCPRPGASGEKLLKRGTWSTGMRSRQFWIHSLDLFSHDAHIKIAVLKP